MSIETADIVDERKRIFFPSVWTVQFPVLGSFRPLYQADGSVNEAECGLYCRPDELLDDL